MFVANEGGPMPRTLLFISVVLMLFTIVSGCGQQHTTAVEPLISTTPLVIATVVTASPTPLPLPTATAKATQEPFSIPRQQLAQPTVPIISGYRPYRVREGDTLESLSRRGGSTPELISSYNRLVGKPQVGRELMIPQVRGKGTLLPYRGMMVLKGNTSKPWVALTIDCGRTTGQLPRMLDALREANAKATFFMVGDQIDNGSVIEQMIAEGHELANHSYSHPDFRELSRTEIIVELERTEEILTRFGGPQATSRPYFRFPYGAYDRRVLRHVLNQGYLPIHWTLDALDTIGEPKTAAFIVERVTTGLPREELGGAIILAHCTSVTAEALPEIIDRFTQWGFELRTLTDVLGP
jgi:peptidoglycan-N-acetylmuramic acid deacetylase